MGGQVGGGHARGRGTRPATHNHHLPNTHNLHRAILQILSLLVEAFNASYYVVFSVFTTAFLQVLAGFFKNGFQVNLLVLTAFPRIDLIRFLFLHE